MFDTLISNKDLCKLDNYTSILVYQGCNATVLASKHYMVQWKFIMFSQKGGSDSNTIENARAIGGRGGLCTFSKKWVGTII